MQIKFVHQCFYRGRKFVVGQIVEAAQLDPNWVAGLIREGFAIAVPETPANATASTVQTGTGPVTTGPATSSPGDKPADTETPPTEVDKPPTADPIVNSDEVSR